jgi:chromosome segregation ATPase
LKSLVSHNFINALTEIPYVALRVDMEFAERELEKIQRVQTKMLEKWKEAVAEGDDLIKTFDAEIHKHADNIKAFKAVINDLKSRIAAYESVAETVNKFQAHCLIVAKGMRRELTFQEKGAALQAINVRVFAAKIHKIRIQLNTGVMCPRSLSQNAGQLIALEFLL